MAKTGAGRVREAQQCLRPARARLTQLGLRPRLASCPGVQLGAPVGPDGEKTDPRAFRPSLQGRSVAAAPQLSLPHRAGQKVGRGLGVTLLEVDPLFLCKVLAHGSWLPTNGPFDVTMTLQVPRGFSRWKGEHLRSGSPGGGCGSYCRSAEMGKPGGRGSTSRMGTHGLWGSVKGSLPPSAVGGTV